MTPALHRWHILVSEPQCEIRAYDGLLMRGFRPYVPRIHKTVASGRGRRREVERAMFTCYLFVNCEVGREPWDRIRAVPGVFDFLSIQGRPASLPDDAIAAIEAREQQLEAARQQKLAQRMKPDRSMFSAGQAVKLDLGPFAELAGKIGRVGGSGNIEVLLEMEFLGRKEVSVDPRRLKVAS